MRALCSYLLAASTLASAACAAPAASPAAGPFACAFGDPQALGPLPTAVTECSGLAASRRHPGVLYTHNDSGDRARFFAIDARSGALLAEYAVTGERAVDWEDLAVGPCAEGSCVYLADIGDNGVARADAAILRLPEPALASASLAADRLPVTYPDGPHNAEALLVDGAGAPYILTKERQGPSQLFRIPTGGAAEALGTYAPPKDGSPLVTGADYVTTAVGARLAVRTYTDVFVYTGPPGATPMALLAGAPTQLPPVSEGQGEAVAFAEDGRALWTASEGAGAALHEFRCE